jgi:hypothetical protein
LLSALIEFVATAEEMLVAAWPDDELESLDDAEPDDDRETERDDPNEDEA